MKKFIFLTLTSISIMLVSTRTNAQNDSSGIYKTAIDFRQRKLSYAINYKTEKHKINNYLLFNSGEIRIKHKGENYALLRNEVYGYRSTNGDKFRFVDNKEYKILNPKEKLLINVYKHPAHSPNEAAKYAPTYLFSTDELSAPQPLTRSNLKIDFAGNHLFHDALDAHFQTDQELYAYDPMHEMYKLNWMLSH